MRLMPREPDGLMPAESRGHLMPTKRQGERV